MSWHAQFYLVKNSGAANESAFIEKLGLQKWESAGRVSFLDATNSDFDDFAIGFCGEWTVFLGKSALMDYKSQAPKPALGLSDESFTSPDVDCLLCDLSRRSNALEILLEGSSGSYGFVWYDRGKANRRRLFSDGETVCDSGTALKEERIAFAASEDGEDRIFGLMKGLSVSIDELIATPMNTFRNPKANSDLNAALPLSKPKSAAEPYRWLKNHGLGAAAAAVIVAIGFFILVAVDIQYYRESTPEPEAIEAEALRQGIPANRHLRIGEHYAYWEGAVDQDGRMRGHGGSSSDTKIEELCYPIGTKDGLASGDTAIHPPETIVAFVRTRRFKSWADVPRKPVEMEAETTGLAINLRRFKLGFKGMEGEDALFPGISNKTLTLIEEGRRPPAIWMIAAKMAVGCLLLYCSGILWKFSRRMKQKARELAI